MRRTIKLADGRLEIVEQLDFADNDRHYAIHGAGLFIEVKYTPGTVGEELFEQLKEIATKFIEQGNEPQSIGKGGIPFTVIMNTEDVGKVASTIL
jgi:hypothetical protein